MKKVLGVVLLVIGIVMLTHHGSPADLPNEAQRTGDIVGQYTANAMFIVAGVWLLVAKGKKK